MSAPLAPSLLAGARERKIAYERSPAFARFADELADAALDAFRSRLSSPLQIQRRAVRVGREEALLGGLGRRRLSSTIAEAGWSCRAVVAVDPEAVSLLVEVMLGGDGARAPQPENRPFTAIERGLTRAFAEAAAEGLNAALARYAPARFVFERAEPRIELATLTQRGENAVAIDYTFEAFGRAGSVALLLPQRALDHMTDALTQAQTRPQGDPDWTRDFEHRVTGAEVALRAIVGVDGYTLGDVACFEIGQIVALPELAQRCVTLTAEGRALFTCELGRSDGRYSVRIAAEHDSDMARAARVQTFPGQAYE